MTKQEIFSKNIYLIKTKSIKAYRAFNTSEDFERFLETLSFYRQSNPSSQFSYYLKHISNPHSKFASANRERMNNLSNGKVQIFAFSILPQKVCLIVRELEGGGVSKFMQDALNSYSRYFNNKHRQCGPLWQGRFKKTAIQSQSELQRLTYQIHQMPVKANLVRYSSEWIASSIHQYESYILKKPLKNSICSIEQLFETNSNEYKKFISKQILGDKEDDV